MLEITAVLLLLALVVGGIAGSLLQRKISRPVRELADAMHDVTERHDFGARVALSGADEIAELGRVASTRCWRSWKSGRWKRRHSRRS